MGNKVEKLIEKSTEAKSADEAMKYAQAALNAANALRQVEDTKKHCA